MDLDTNLILHIGHSKTASTSIQQTLANARGWLLERQVLYPELAVSDYNHRALLPAAHFGVTAELRIRMGKTPEDVQSDSRRAWEATYAQLASAQPRTVILSAEGILRKLNDRQATALKERLLRISRRTPRILAYVRSPAAFYISNAQQNLKSGSGIPVPKPLRRMASVASYESCFSTKVELHAFERKQLAGGDAVADFATWIGMPNLSTEFAVQESNQSLSAEAMSVLHRLGPTTAPADAAELKRQRSLLKLVVQADAALNAPTKPKLLPEVAGHINALNPDFIQLRDDYGLNFEDIDYASLAATPRAEVPVRSLEDICAFDRDRRDELQNRVTKAATRRAFPDWLRRKLRIR